MLQSDRYWSDFCRAVGIEELEKAPRFENLFVRQQHSAEMVAILDKVFASKTREEWISQLRAMDLLVTPVNTISDLENDPQVLANDYITEYDHPILGRKIKMVGIPVQLSRTPGSIRLPAPDFGQHTEEVLLEAGYNWDEIGKLKEQEVI
jgi:crotonobetainyl-CoA:carnitine CoA-transferase CaiB-like acyl-CoA transferase